MNNYSVLESTEVELNAGSRPHPRYLAFVSVFNSGLYFEAHEVLEPLWLGVRGQPEAPFYKGLIQLAGAFVHVTKGRVVPSISLFKLARKNLSAFAPVCDELDVTAVLRLIDGWLARLNPTSVEPITSLPPESRRLKLIPATATIS